MASGFLRDVVAAWICCGLIAAGAWGALSVSFAPSGSIEGAEPALYAPAGGARSAHLSAPDAFQEEADRLAVRRPDAKGKMSSTPDRPTEAPAATLGGSTGRVPDEKVVRRGTLHTS
jgi:hypothetical protein